MPVINAFFICLGPLSKRVSQGVRGVLLPGRVKCGMLTVEQLFNCISMRESIDEAPDPQCTSVEHRTTRVGISTVSLERASRIFRALGDSARLRLMVLLAQGEACVTELAAAEGDEISTVSQRLRVLRAEELVARRRRGKHVLYGLADQHVADLISNALAHASEHRSKGLDTTRHERGTV